MKKAIFLLFASLYFKTTNAQNVGIGTTSPTSKLQVDGAIRIQGAQTSHKQGISLEWNKDNGSGATYLLNQSGLGGGGLIFGEVDTGNNVTERLVINQNGNVGIGTATPSTNLDINGGLRTKYSSQVVVNILNTNTQELHLQMNVPVPSGWDLTNTMVIVNNVDGGTGVIHQAKLESSYFIKLIYTPDLVGLVRFSFIIFLNGPLTFSFPVSQICDQIWMVKNLEVSTYRDGTPIPQVTDPSVWPSLTTGAWCWYNNDSATYASTYGKLYNWFAVNDPRGLAPLGWHIPSDAEWSTLSTCLGGDAVAGGKMKETGTTHWISPNTGADNSSGFLGLPGGSMGSGFFNLGYNGYFWSSSEAGAYNAWIRVLNYDNILFHRTNIGRPLGLSVRCVRD